MFEGMERNNTNFPGIWLGVVEDNNDPNKAGRVRVRILGIHSENKSITSIDGIPTKELPWAIPAIPIAEGGANGLGLFSVPVQGSWVAMFLVGESHEYPVYFASIAGNPMTKPDTSKGFSDPNEKYPLYVGEPDWNRNARAEGELIKDKKDSVRKTGIQQMKSGSWEEPTSPYATQYPFNTVFETRDQGLVIEYDSSPGSERYHVYHKKSGNYFEIAENGRTVYKSKANNYEINMEGKNVRIEENYNLSVGGDKDELIEGDLNSNTSGNMDERIDGNQMTNIGGALSITVKGKCTVIADIIELDGSSGGTTTGVITNESICHFTGLPHADCSINVKATKT